MLSLVDILILLLGLVWFFAGLAFITDLVLDNIGKVKRRIKTFWPKRQKAPVAKQ